MLEYIFSTRYVVVCICVLERCGCWWRAFWVNLRSCINELNRQFIDQKWNSWGIFHRSILLRMCVCVCVCQCNVRSLSSSSSLCFPNHSVGTAICMFASKHFVYILCKTHLVRANVCEHSEIMHRFSTIYPMEKSIKKTQEWLQLSSKIYYDVLYGMHISMYISMRTHMPCNRISVKCCLRLLYPSPVHIHLLSHAMYYNY